MKSGKNWDSIDVIPAYNFLKFVQTQDLKWLGNPSTKILEKINDEYMAILLQNKEFVNELKNKAANDIIKYDAEVLHDPIASIKMQALNLDNVKKSDNFDIWKMVVNVEKKMGFQIDIHKIPTSQFFAYVNL